MRAAPIAVLAGALMIAGIANAKMTGPTESVSKTQKFAQGVHFANIGDTMIVRFALQTDTVLKTLPGDRIIPVKCGVGKVYLRIYSPNVGPKFGTQLYADTVSIPVCNETPVRVAVATVSVCVNADTLAFKAFQVRGDTTVDPAKITCNPLASIDTGKVTQAIAIARDSAGNVITGRHIDWSIVDPGISPAGVPPHQASFDKFGKRTLALR